MIDINSGGKKNTGGQVKFFATAYWVASRKVSSDPIDSSKKITPADPLPEYPSQERSTPHLDI